MLRYINNRKKNKKKQEQKKKRDRNICFRMPLSYTMLHFTLLIIVALIYSTHLQPVHYANAINNASEVIQINDGLGNLAEGERLFHLENYEEAAPYYWRAVLAQEASGEYSVNDAFEPFLKCYAIRGMTIDAFLYITRESIMRGQTGIAKVYVARALEIDPQNLEALEMQKLIESGDDISALKDTFDKGGDVSTEDAMRFYSEGTNHFNQKNFALAAESFDKACPLAAQYSVLNAACVNAVYCRSNILEWGPNGETFQKDMETIIAITQKEVAEQSVDANGVIRWNKATSVHPHMMLGYPVGTLLKRYVAESYAAMDEPQARRDANTGIMKDLPPDVPYNNDLRRENFILDAMDPNFKIKIAFVSSGFNTKAVLYLSKDMFRFFDKKNFEVHIFSMGAADNPKFIEISMRGVDWRERVKVNVDFFHDVQHLKDEHVELARMIHDAKIHILIEWDGYARQGTRAQGLFALHPAPILILHQEYLGTTGADYIDYIITDRTVSPEHLEDDYTENFMYMPNHFFSKGHAMQDEVNDPTYDFKPMQTPYIFGTGSPQENRCLSPASVGPQEVSFVYCNFNKFLKNNPGTVLSWIEILRQVPNSILCLLENPTSGVPYLRKFIKEAAALSSNGGVSDGDDLNSRIHFLQWEGNPYDHQMRNQDFCNVGLDSHPYNGHTTAQDALYGGVPIVTRSDGDDMASRVTTSANIVLGLEQLNAYDGPAQYEDIAIRLGTNPFLFGLIRSRLIDTCLMRNPMHPYWDVERYVKNIQTLFIMAWETYLSGKGNRHLYLSANEERPIEDNQEEMDNGSYASSADGNHKEL